MQYLAKVHKKAFMGGAALALLAVRTAEATWERIPQERLVETPRMLGFGEGSLVLVELDALNQVTGVEDAIPWVLSLVEQYLIYGVTPAALEQEIEIGRAHV